MDALLTMNIVDGPFVDVVYALALCSVAFLAARRPSRRWMLTGAGSLLSGTIASFVVLSWASETNAFGVDLSPTTTAWVYAVFSAVGLAVGNLWKSRWPRKVVASMAIILFAITGTVGINADFGLDRTLADLAGLPTQKPISLPRNASTTAPTRPVLAGGALWANWVAPHSQPAVGRIGSVVIANTLSGFRSRPAGLYLPPAALAKDPPLLPLVVMMMGQPGNPDPSFQKPILDDFAARHNGLAPIVLVVDQLGDPSIDTLCLDTAKHGKAESFLVGDVVAWARTHLHVLPDAAHWTIAGYSNGGECALSLGAKHPEIWGNVLDISGEEYPGSDHPGQTLARDFAGSTAAYQAVRPLTVLAGRHYVNTVGIFTVGSNDGAYVAQARRVEAAARAAGWTTTYFEVPNGGHVLGALNGGLREGYRVLYPRLGLSAPATSP